MLLLQFTGPILRLFGQSAAVASVAQEYNQGASAGLVFFLLYVNSRSVMGAVGRPKPLTVIMLLAVPASFLIGWAFIFGTPFTAAGRVFGAGLSSTVVRLLIAIAAYAVLLRARAFRDLKLSESPHRPDLVALRDLSVLGLPIGVRILLGEGFLPVIAFFVAQYGADATAAHAIGLRVESLIAQSMSALIALLFPQIQTQVFGLNSVAVSSDRHDRYGTHCRGLPRQDTAEFVVRLFDCLDAALVESRAGIGRARVLDEVRDEIDAPDGEAEPCEVVGPVPWAASGIEDRAVDGLCPGFDEVPVAGVNGIHCSDHLRILGGPGRVGAGHIEHFLRLPARTARFVGTIGHVQDAAGWALRPREDRDLERIVGWIPASTGTAS